MEKENVVLKVCLRSNSTHGTLNDNTCEKCLRTILSLVLANIDPNDCGFYVDDSTFPNMKNFWLNRKSTKKSTTWREAQQLIPENIEYDLYGSKEFFKWFREFDFETTVRNQIYKDIYNALPYSLAQILDKIYNKFGINVHEDPLKRNIKHSMSLKKILYSNKLV